MSWPGDRKEQKALLDRVMPMVKKLAKKRARLGRVVTEDECVDIARWAAEDAVATHDGEKGDLACYVHARVDQALLDEIAKRRRRESLPVVAMLRAMYSHAREMKQRGSLLHDSDEETLNHLHDACEELAGTFGLRLGASAEAECATSEEARAVHATLDELTDHERQILWGCFAEERTLKDLAGATGTSISTVHRDLQKAILRFIALLRRRGVGGSRDEEPGEPAGPGGRPSLFVPETAAI